MHKEVKIIWSLYRIVNKSNGKVYIGQAADVSKRWSDHRKAVRSSKPTQIVHHAMIKYGLDNFDFEIIACCINQENANYTETELVSQYNSFVKNGGYNATLGGMNASKTEEWKRKVSEKLMGHEVSQETRAKVSKGNRGKVRSEEFKINVGDFWRGKERSEEHKNNLSESLKGNQNCLGKKNGLGYRHTAAAKEKIAIASRRSYPEFKGKTWKIIDGKRIWMEKTKN